MVGKLFVYTGIVICLFNKLKKKNHEISIFVTIMTIFVEKCYFGLYFTAEMDFGKEVIIIPQNIINHNFIKYPNSMVWKLDVYINITITYFGKPKTR